MALDNFRSQMIIWDKANRRIYEDVRASSGDENGRRLTVQVVNDGVVENLTGFSLNLAWETKKGDEEGLDAFRVIDATKGIFELTYKTGMLKNVGKLKAQLVLIGSDISKITSETFTITVFDSVGTGGVSSSNELSALVTALATVNRYDARIGATENEIKAARGTHFDLKTRLETEKQAFANQLQTTDNRIDELLVTGTPTEGNSTLLDGAISASGKNYGTVGTNIRKTQTGEAIMPNAVTGGQISFFDWVVIADNTTTPYLDIAVGGNATTPPDRRLVNIGDTRRSLVFKSKPNTTYKITKDKSTLFRVSSTETYPIEGTPHTFIKDEYQTGIPESTETEYTFESKSEQWVIIYVSATSENPKIRVEAKQITNKNVARDAISPINTTFMVHYTDSLINPYVKLGIGGNATTIRANRKITSGDSRRSLVFKCQPNTTYKIKKEVSSLFRITGTPDYPEVGALHYFIKDENKTGIPESTETEYIFKSGISQWITIYVSLTSEEPFLTVEEVRDVDNTYKIPSQYIYTTEPSMTGESEYVSVESFRTGLDTDTTTIQKAFNNAGGRIVSFETGKTYYTDAQLVADAGRVRGIEGNSAKIIADLNGVAALKYYGSLSTSGSTGPAYPPNEVVQENEMNGYINRLNIRSKTPYKANGIEVGNSIGLTVQNCKLYKLKNGLITSGIARNFIYENNYIYNNSENGMLFNDVDIHQFQIIGGHISYNYNNIKFLDSDIANAQLTGVSLENNTGNASTGFLKSGSLITFESTGVLRKVRKHLYEAIMIVGCNIQDHNTNNLKPLINIDMPDSGVSDIMVGNNLIGNSSAGVPAIYLKGVNGAIINNNSIVGYEYARFNTSIKVDGINKLININNNHLEKPIDYSTAIVEKLKISDNMLEGFTMADSNDGNIFVKDNF